MFTKLGKTKPYTDIICIGVTIDKKPYFNGKEQYSEKIHGFHTIHLRPKDGRLHRVGDILTWDCDDIFTCVTNYLPTRNNVLIVCNHSLVVLGSSDFTERLERKDIILHRGDISEANITGKGNKTYDTQSFVVSCPPTIVMFSNTNNGNSYTLVDVNNYGIRYMIDIYNNLKNEDKDLIHNTAELGISVDDSLTCATLIARFMQEKYSVNADNKLGGIGLTYSSEGMRIFRGRFYQDNILTHTNEDARMIEDECYVGGRIEPLYHGEYHGKAYLIDIMSLYPHLGRIKRYPTSLHSCENNPSKQTIEKWIEKGIVFAKCHISTTVPAYPIRRGQNLSFPTGDFNCFLCADEFNDAWKEGRINKVYSANFYNADYILKEYSQFMLDLRTKYKGCNNRLAEYIVKSVTNGLWGKFAQYGHLWQIMENEVPDRQYGGYLKFNKELQKNEQYRIIDWQVSKLIHAPYIDNTFRPISATINSYSRHYVWRHILQAGLHNILYCCVDGLIVTQEGIDRLAWLIAPTPYQYGMYKISEKGNNCIILGHGMYQIGDKIAYVGTPKYDVKQCKGFWSTQRDRNILPMTSENAGKSIVTNYRHPDNRQELINRGKVKGYFTARETMEEPILPGIDSMPSNHQPYFHEPEWLS